MNGAIAATYTGVYAVVHQNGPFNYCAFFAVYVVSSIDHECVVREALSHVAVYPKLTLKTITAVVCHCHTTCGTVRGLAKDPELTKAFDTLVYIYRWGTVLLSFYPVLIHMGYLV